MPNLDPITGFPIPEERTNSGLDQFAAGMALSNPISGWADRRFSPDYQEDKPEAFNPDYDPWADKRIEKYDPMHFVDSMSEEETGNIIASLDRNMALQERSDSWKGTAGQVTGVFTNPLIMLPAIATGGQSIPAMMAAESGGEILSEMLLHSQQPLRTKVESALNIGIAGAAAGAGGLIARKLDRSASREATDTAHGGDGMYAYPKPDEAEGKILVPPDAVSKDASEDIVTRAADDTDEGITIYHGRATELTAESRHKETGVHFTESKELAEDISKYGVTGEEEIIGGVVTSTKINPNKMLELPDIIDDLKFDMDELWTPAAIHRKLTDEGLSPPAFKNEDDVWKYLESEGYDGIKYTNEAEGGTSYLLNPKKVVKPDDIVAKEIKMADEALARASERVAKARAKVQELGC